ncbi:MAG: nucleotidyl transferase, partial [Actinomycetes bacterium]
HGRDQMEAHLAAVPQVHVSVEEPEALGTAGALGALRDWLQGDSVLVVNADTVHDADLIDFVDGWDGDRVRVLTTTSGAFGPQSTVVASLLPATAAAALQPVASGLWEVVWREGVARGRIDAAHHRGWCIDAGTAAGYLAANLAVSGGQSVIGAGATVAGSLERSLVWPGSVVAVGEHLRSAIRAESLTVLVR